MGTVDVLVAGAGPAGLAVARAAALAGRSVCVLDGAPREASGSGLTLWPNAAAALRCLGVENVEGAARACEGMRMSRPDGVVLQHIDAPTMVAACGGNGLAITRADLLDCLRATLPSGVAVERTVLRDIDDVADLVRVRTDHGDLSARVLVGADGAHSRVRALLPGSGRDRQLSMRVIRGLSPLTVSPYPAEVTMGRGLQFGVFSLVQGTYWFAAYPTHLDGRSPAATATTLFGGWHAPIADLIASTPSARLLSQDVIDRKPSSAAWGRHRVTLAGDAAHLAAPTMGQGTCHAFEDAVALGNALARSLEPESLRRYEAARAPRSAEMVRQSHVAAVTGQWRNPAFCAMRDRLIRTTPTWLQIRQLRSIFTFDDADVLAHH